MDKAIKYQQILCEVLQEYGEIEKKLTPDVKRHIIIDNERNAVA